MKTTRSIFLFSFMVIIAISCVPKREGKNLFILSGQSNMKRLNIEESFVPAIESAFGADNVIIIKDSQGGQPIRRWYKDWQPLEGSKPADNGDLYDRLMKIVKPAMDTNKIKTVTFIWMQGERDAKESQGDVYERSLLGLYDQLCKDLGRKDINFVIGRISDHDLSNKNYPDWTMIRDIQVKVADSNPRFEWVSTDDCNDGTDKSGEKIQNGLHMTREGYKVMGKRFADKAIQLLEEND